MKMVINIFYYLFIVAIALLGFLLLMNQTSLGGGLKIKIVQSGSMEPTIKTGGIVLVRPTEVYQVGDIITFGKDTKTQVPTTHRILEISGARSNKTFTTKGDANDEKDPLPTRASDVQGRVVFDIPYVGYILDFARKPLGFALLVGVPALAVILEEFGKIWREARRIRRRRRALKGASREMSSSRRLGIDGVRPADFSSHEYQEKTS